MTDYLIIGSGIAGISFAETALKNNKTIAVFDNDSQNSSKIAGGLYNPVILKRFTEVNNAGEYLKEMNSFFEALEHKLQTQFKFDTPILRKFFSVEEQNNWFAASDKITLSSYLSTQIRNTKYAGIASPFGYGEVLQTGYVDTVLLLKTYKDFLKSTNSYCNEAFDYGQLQINSEGLVYKDTAAKHLVFAEGFGLHANPFFNNLPLDGTKGELFVIKAPQLHLDVILNTSVFILPLGDALFKVGATYNWQDKTDIPTQEGKTELIDRIKEIIQCDFEIISHLAGVRPTVKDRRPLVGTHNIHKNLHILNGLGTRGLMLGPSMAKELFENIEYKKPLDKEISIERFYKKQG